MTDKEKQTLISFCKQNPILWDNAYPNYRKKVKRYLIKLKLVTLFDSKLSEEFLEKCLHSLRTSMIREMKKSGNGNESNGSFIKTLTFWLDH